MSDNEGEAPEQLNYISPGADHLPRKTTGETLAIQIADKVVGLTMLSSMLFSALGLGWLYFERHIAGWVAILVGALAVIGMYFLARRVESFLHRSSREQTGRVSDHVPRT